MKKSNILLVDDDELYLYLMKKSIKTLSKELSISSFTDGEQAVDFIASRTEKNDELPDIIFLDIDMPFLDGWGFLNEFKKLKPKIENKINIYLVTSSMRESDKKKAEDFEELTAYVVKPVVKSELVEIFTEIYNTDWR